MKHLTQMLCPRCGGRAFDISNQPKVILKCPRCQNVVAVNCTQPQKSKVAQRELHTI